MDRALRVIPMRLEPGVQASGAGRAAPCPWGLGEALFWVPCEWWWELWCPRLKADKPTRAPSESWKRRGKGCKITSKRCVFVHIK